MFAALRAMASNPGTAPVTVRSAEGGNSDLLWVLSKAEIRIGAGSLPADVQEALPLDSPKSILADIVAAVGITEQGTW